MAESYEANRSEIRVNMCGITFSSTQRSSLESHIIYPGVFMDSMSPFQQAIIYLSIPEVVEPFYDVH